MESFQFLIGFSTTPMDGEGRFRLMAEEFQFLIGFSTTLEEMVELEELEEEEGFNSL